ncbi:MAG: DUF4357 domain-containing protein [Bacteroidaceae bacterium]|nr:DUF4357 domain-containing protein [Bacteroidaceae bacterium]
MQDTWNLFVHYLSEDKKNNVSEAEYHSTIEKQLGLLGWMIYRNEILHKPNLPIGNHNFIQPDILIQKEDKKQFVIEVKRPLHVQTAQDCDQLVSYMRQLKLEAGIYIGEHIEIFYDQPQSEKAVSVLKIPLELDNKRGARFVELFSKEHFNKEAIVQFCENRIKEMQHQESLNKIKENLVNEAQQQITEGMKMYLMEKYGNAFSESDIINMLTTIEFTATPKGGKQPNAGNSNSAPVPQEEDIICFLCTRNADAKGIFNISTQTLTVLKGSTINPQHRDSIKPKDKQKRETLIAEYTEYKDGTLVVVKDVVFHSPSGAALFCVGGSENGWKCWKDEKNNELNTYRK